MSDYATVTATVTAPGLEPVEVHAATVATWSLPLTAEWKRAYRETVLLGLGHYPRPGDGWRVKFTAAPL